MATQKPGEWANSLLARFEDQVIGVFVWKFSYIEFDGSSQKSKWHTHQHTHIHRECKSEKRKKKQQQRYKKCQTVFDGDWGKKSSGVCEGDGAENVRARWTIQCLLFWDIFCLRFVVIDGENWWMKSWYEWKCTCVLGYFSFQLSLSHAMGWRDIDLFVCKQNNLVSYAALPFEFSFCVHIFPKNVQYRKDMPKIKIFNYIFIVSFFSFIF